MEKNLSMFLIDNKLYYNFVYIKPIPSKWYYTVGARFIESQPVYNCIYGLSYKVDKIEKKYHFLESFCDHLALVLDNQKTDNIFKLKDVPNEYDEQKIFDILKNQEDSFILISCNGRTVLVPFPEKDLLTNLKLISL